MKFLIIAIIVMAVLLLGSKKKGGAAAGSQRGSSGSAAKPAAAAQKERVIINGLDYTADFHRQHSYFTPIIRNNFIDYQIEENVPMSKLVDGASRNYKDLDFVLSKRGQVVAVIDICHTHSHRKAVELCRRHGIKHISFYDVYENRDSYVVERIKEQLN